MIYLCETCRDFTFKTRSIPQVKTGSSYSRDSEFIGDRHITHAHSARLHRAMIENMLN